MSPHHDKSYRKRGSGMINFETILKLTQEELKKALHKEMREIGYQPISKDGFLYAPGSVPVLLVAHLDTVHQKIPEIICYSKDERYIMSPQGIGGDDRAGVYMILQIIKKARCHVLFCEDEETGGQGASKFVKSKIPLPVYYIIEVDRQGCNDAVYYQCDNPEFTTFVDEFGFTRAHGSFSDISIIAPHFDIAAVNISAGYYNAHRSNEFIDMKAVQYNIDRIVEMVNAEYGPFRYIDWQVNAKESKQCSIFDLPEEDENNKYLSPLPSHARLIVNGCEIKDCTSYMMDKDRNIYFYAADLCAAVESLNSYACDSSGKEIRFSFMNAKRITILSCEEALHKLSA